MCIQPYRKYMDMWIDYVQRLLTESGKREKEFVAGLTAHQGTFNRWKLGVYSPDKAVDVAQFARDCGRNPLEAFVAAGMLDEDEAGRGLRQSERDYLAELRKRAARRVRHGELLSAAMAAGGWDVHEIAVLTEVKDSVANQWANGLAMPNEEQRRLIHKLLPGYDDDAVDASPKKKREAG